MDHKPATLVWRVRAPDGAVHPAAFDALVLPAETRGAVRSARHLGLAVPYEGELADAPMTLIVRPRPGIGTLIVEGEAFDANGDRVFHARGTMPLTAIVRSTTGVAVTGLPEAEGEPGAPPI